MKMSALDTIRKEIGTDPANRKWASKGLKPLYTASRQAKIVIVGQAPGKKAQESGKPWNDASGVKLRSWLGVSDEQFYDPTLIALVPMDFYYPGKGAHGDLPPRKEFAAKWHPRLLAEMPNVQLIIVIGNYSQKYYLGSAAKGNLTDTVKSYQDYFPKYFPLVHPSPLNFRWLTKNPWFEKEVVSTLRRRVKKVLS